MTRRHYVCFVITRAHDVHDMGWLPVMCLGLLTCGNLITPACQAHTLSPPSQVDSLLRGSLAVVRLLTPSALQEDGPSSLMQQLTLTPTATNTVRPDAVVSGADADGLMTG